MPVVVRLKYRDKRRLLIGLAGAAVSMFLLIATLPTHENERDHNTMEKETPPPPRDDNNHHTGHVLEKLPGKIATTRRGETYVEIIPLYNAEENDECVNGVPVQLRQHSIAVVGEGHLSVHDADHGYGVIIGYEKFDVVSAVHAYAKKLDDDAVQPEYVIIRSGCVEVDSEKLIEGLVGDNDVTGVTCGLVHEGVIVSDGLEAKLVGGDEVEMYPRLHGFSEYDKRRGGSDSVIVPHTQCVAMRVSDVYQQVAQHCIVSNPACFTASLWDIHLSLKSSIKVVSSGKYPSKTLSGINSPITLLKEKHHDQLIQSVHQSRESKIHSFDGDGSLLGMTLLWDTYCSCTGVNIEVIQYLTEMEKYVNTRAVADDNCWCKGFPDGVVSTLGRLTRPKDLDMALGDVIHEDEQVVVWVAHKPADRYPDFPYRGVINWVDRPDWVVGRSMTEVDKISPAWVTSINEKVDEVWVPSTFMEAAFRSSGVTVPVTVIPESIDVWMYDPEVVEPYPDIPEGFNFMSNFKWEPRKGWDLLLTAFFTLYKKGDGVNLVLKTHLYMESDPHNPQKILAKIHTFAKKHNFPLDTLPTVHIVSQELPAAEMPRLYKAVDCFVLPTRGEGWGLPMHEAMSMGLPTIATNWGGNTHFMTAENSLLVATNGTERAKGFPGNWAVPSLTDLKTKMAWVKDNPKEAAALGATARRSIVSSFSQEAVAPIIVKRLLQIKTTVLGKKR